MSNDINVILIGSYPPPYGGVSVHIERLHQYLHKKGINCKVLHTGPKNVLLDNNKDILKLFNVFNLIKIKRTDPIIHFHVSALRNLLKIFILSHIFYNQKKIITIHSGTFIKNIMNQSKLKNILLKKVIKYFNHIVTVNGEQKKLLISILKIDKNKISVIPAFIHPSASLKEFSPKDISLIEKTDKIKLVMSGSLLGFYGYELVLNYLENNEKCMGFFIFYGTHNDKYKNQIIDRINNLRNAYYFQNLTPAGFNWLLKKSDIYVRNTDRDGDCVAIREANFWGLSVCASNAVDRPEGTHLFTFNNKAEFSAAIQNAKNEETHIRISSDINYADSINKLYRNL